MRAIGPARAALAPQAVEGLKAIRGGDTRAAADVTMEESAKALVVLDGDAATVGQPPGEREAAPSSLFLITVTLTNRFSYTLMMADHILGGRGCSEPPGPEAPWLAPAPRPSKSIGESESSECPGSRGDRAGLDSGEDNDSQTDDSSPSDSNGSLRGLLWASSSPAPSAPPSGLEERPPLAATP
eukprot:CAMPEP_0184327272 /NCGR_PEP_ID=MMETSP1049-20130417/143008_1 /TAXON_ID=77928 /ORGANISM="Proteomonas sulcata, Strain CCMP704" /LENGTH=183 /DNA_ID=CAMNT_0026649523 /DNA_START=1757 /DNA_END=2305 /DNA_ORIENTATION=-